MKSSSVNALASAKQHQARVRAGRAFFKALLIVSTLLGSGVAIQPADASLLVTTMGTILSGSETGGLFGLPIATTDLSGKNYTLIVKFDNLGPNYFTTGDGTFASDFESPGVTGSVTAIVNGQSLTTALTNSLGSNLFEDPFDFFAANQGYNGPPATSSFVDVSQNLSPCANQCVPFADLLTAFTYTLGPNDIGSDSYTFQGAGFPAASAPVANFTTTERSLAFAIVVPEPSSWMLLATGLLGLSMVARRRSSNPVSPRGRSHYTFAS